MLAMVGSIEIRVCFGDKIVRLVVNICIMSGSGPMEIGSGQFKILGFVEEVMVENT